MKKLTTYDIEKHYSEDDQLAPVRRSKAARILQRAKDKEIPEIMGLPIIKTFDGAPITCWSHDIERQALQQLGKISRLPIIHSRGIAVMPDIHPGVGSCVGTVLPMKGALVPSAVGLDAGCGMVAVKLDLKSHQLPDNLRKLRFAIEAAIPVGTGGIHDNIADNDAWNSLEPIYKVITDKHPQIFKKTAALQLGTLGSGNHFIEICLDEQESVWVMIHSGSRGAGGLIGQHFINLAQREAAKNGFNLEDKGLSWLPEGTDGFVDYTTSLLWAQEYAKENRKVMMKLALAAIRDVIGKNIKIIGKAINCHHNYAVKENHFGEDLWITRKGAIRAGAGELGIIPGSMGAQSFIVRGKGAAHAYCSSSHGAGRIMSRKAARESFTTADLRKQTAGVECRKDRDVIDEIPSAYKNISRVMAEQKDLVEIIHTLKQVVCVKGS